MPALHLAKRDNMGYLIPPIVIWLLTLLGAAVAVTLGYAVHRLMGLEDAPPWKSRSGEQDDYMRDVRRRNLERLMAMRGHNQR